MILIEVDDAHVAGVLRDLTARLGDLTPVMQTLGEVLAKSTMARFVTSIGPNGTPWQRNTETTYLRYLEQKNGVTLEKGENAGRLNAKGVDAAVGKKPLVGVTKRLSTEIHAEPSADGVAIGSSLVYAAVQQFGAKMGAFGRYSQVSRRNQYKEGDFRKHAGTVQGFPIPWGDIPARPYIGLSTADDDSVLKIMEGYLKEATLVG